MSDTALVVIARYPQAGTTKTRLAQTIGDHLTVGLYRAFLTDLATRFSGQDYALYWTYTPPEVDYRAFIASRCPTAAQVSACFPQQGPDLGARLLHAFRQTQALGYRKTVLIGSDSPHISQAIVKQAQDALDHADVVLGPAVDGGYYLIAMRQPHDVFTSIPMSTPLVKEMTLAAAQRQSLRVHLLETLFDVDELPDLQRLALLLNEDKSLAPATAAYLATIRNVYEYNSTDTTAFHLH